MQNKSLPSVFLKGAHFFFIYGSFWALVDDFPEYVNAVSSGSISVLTNHPF